MSDDGVRIVELALREHLTLAVAESVTGGLVCDALVSVPGASAVVKGGVVAYDLAVKRDVLGVSQTMLDHQGPVSHAVARAMARGVRRALGADVGVATTGVAGPEPHGGHQPGTVVIAVDTPWGHRVRTLHLEGGRAEVRDGATAAALAELVLALSTTPHKSS